MAKQITNSQIKTAQADSYTTNAAHPVTDFVLFGMFIE